MLKGIDKFCMVVIYMLDLIFLMLLILNFDVESFLVCGNDYYVVVEVL